jgi:hypothetical protein
VGGLEQEVASAADDLLGPAPELPEPPDDAVAKTHPPVGGEVPDVEPPAPGEAPVPVEVPPVVEPPEVPQAPEVVAPPDVQPTPTVPKWESLDAVKMDEVPEEHKPWVQAVFDAAQVDHADLERVKAQMISRMSEFDELIKQMTESGVPDAAPLAQRVEATTKELQAVQGEYVAVAWSAFEARHPEYAGLPQNVKDAFADLIEAEGFGTKFSGRNDLERLEDAFNYAKFKTQFRPVETPVAPAPVVPTARLAPGVKPPPPSRQAAVAATTQAPLPPRVRAEDKEPADILKAHDRLLGDLPER